ncbi:MAG TPA: hypothetical protein VI318_14695 [Baekduia sp.]
MRMTHRHAAVAACAITAAFALAGCGDSKSTYDNAQRPPSPIVVSASIDDQSVQVSPRKFGAGPITLIISNQSSASQRVTLESDGGPGDSGPGQKAIETGPINPRETASVKGDVSQGTYALRVGGGDVKAARITVGKERPSSQNDLLQP